MKIIVKYLLILKAHSAYSFTHQIYIEGHCHYVFWYIIIFEMIRSKEGGFQTLTCRGLGLPRYLQKEQGQIQRPNGPTSCTPSTRGALVFLVLHNWIPSKISFEISILLLKKKKDLKTSNLDNSCVKAYRKKKHILLASSIWFVLSGPTKNCKDYILTKGGAA